MERGQVIRSAGVVGGLTLWSRVLGLVRDILMASFFGTGLAMSAFVVAFTIPNLFRRLFGEGAISAAFMPVYIETRDRDGPEQAWLLARRVLTIVGLFLSAVVVVGIIGITLYLARPEIGERAGMILPLLRIMLPYTVFICMGALCMALLNAHHYFAISAFAPSLLNLIWIATLVLICPWVGETPEEQIYAVAWAVFGAGLVQWGVQIPQLRRLGFKPGWQIETRDPKVRRVFRLMGPASLGMAITQINVLVDRLMAVWIGPWAPAALFFSERLIYFPQGIFATALSTVLLPVFSRQAAQINHSHMLQTINHALRNLLYVMIPAAVGLFVLAGPIVHMIFARGAFGDASTTFTARALMFYAPGLLIFSLSKVFVPVFYALQDTRTPVIVAFWTVLLKIALSLLFILTWPEYWKHAGLALATVIGETINGGVLAWLLHRRLGSPGWREIGYSAGRCLAAALGMGVIAWSAHRWLAEWLPQVIRPAGLAQAGAVLTAIGLAVAAYGLFTWLLGSPEIKSVKDALARKLARQPSP